VRRYYSSFSYRAGSWTKPRRVVAKVEWHRGELYPRIGFVVTNLVRPAERIVAFYNHRGTCEQYINEGKGAIKVDAAVMPILCRQRGSPSAPCPGLQRMARPICKLRFTGMSDQSAPTYPVSRRRPGQDGDPRIPVLITSAASSAM